MMRLRSAEDARLRPRASSASTMRFSSPDPITASRSIWRVGSALAINLPLADQRQSSRRRSLWLALGPGCPRHRTIVSPPMPPPLKIVEVRLLIDAKPTISSTLAASAKSPVSHEDRLPRGEKKRKPASADAKLADFVTQADLVRTERGACTPSIR